MVRRPAILLIRFAGLIVLCGLLYVALFPHTAAACGSWDMKCPVDVGFYSLIVAIAEGLWKFNRLMLYMARLIEGLRTWLLGDVLATALDATVVGMRFPFWIACGVAWIVFVLSFLLQFIVRIDWVDLRKGLRNAIFAVILFSIGSRAMAGMEQVRITVGQGFSAIAATSINAGAQGLGFYASHSESAGDSMDQPHSIYDGADGCPGIDLARRPPVMFMSDYMANFLDADAHDIHCPSGAGTADLPDGFIKRFEIRDISNEDDATRARLMLEARWGLARQAQAVLPAIGAVLEQTMHLVFALALASIWFGLVISMMFSLFLPTEGMFKAQIDAIIATLKTSWLASFWVGLGLTLIGLAANNGNALVVNGLSLGMFVVFYFQIRGAIGTLRSSAGIASTTLGQAPMAAAAVARSFGSAARLAGQFGMGAAIIGAAAATGHKAELAEAGLQQLRRRLAYNPSGGLIAQAGQRLLVNKALGPVERWVQDEKDQRAIDQQDDETQWYEQRLKGGAMAPDEKARALRRTDEIDRDVEGRREARAKRQLHQMREAGRWEDADRHQQQVDTFEIDRLERQIDEAHRSGDPKRIAQIPQLQRRVDSLRGGASAAAEAANGSIGATLADARRPEPLFVGLQEVGLAAGANGRLTVNGHMVTGMQRSADGHQVSLSAGDRVVDISREDANSAATLRPGQSLMVPAHVHEAAPSGPALRLDDDDDMDLTQRIQAAQHLERGLVDLREVAFQQHRFADARQLSEQINLVRARIAGDRMALAAMGRGGSNGAVQVPAPPTGGAAPLSPRAGTDDLAYVPPPGASELVSSSGDTPERRYQSDLRGWQSYVEQSTTRLTALQQQQQQLRDQGREAEAQALDQRVAQAETHLQRSQTQYNRIAGAPPAGVAPAPQIVVGTPGVVPVTSGPALVTPGTVPAPATATHDVAAAPSVVVPAPPSGPVAPNTAIPVAATSTTAPPASAAPAASPAVSGPAMPTPSAQPVMVQQPAPVVQGGGVPQPAPVVQSVSVPQPAPMVQSVSVPQPAPVVQSVSVPQPASVAAPVAVPAPAAPTAAVQSVGVPQPAAVPPPAPAAQPAVPTPAGAGPALGNGAAAASQHHAASGPGVPAPTPAVVPAPTREGSSGSAALAVARASESAGQRKPRPWQNRERRARGSRGNGGQQ